MRLFYITLYLVFFAATAGCSSIDMAGSSDNQNTAKTSNVNSASIKSNTADKKIEQDINKARDPYNCADIDTLVTIIGGSGTVPHSMLRGVNITNFSANLGKVQRVDTYTVGGPPPALFPKFRFLDWKITDRKGICGKELSSNWSVSGYLSAVKNVSTRRDSWVDDEPMERYILFWISGQSSQTSIIDGKPFGLFFVDMCVSRKIDGGYNPDTNMKECNDVKMEAVFCAYGYCNNGRNESQRSPISKLFEERNVYEISVFTDLLYKNDPQKLLSIPELPAEMAIVVDKLSGKYAKNEKIRLDKQTKEFLKNFDVKIVKTTESPLRSVTGASVVTSEVGACKDIEKEIVIRRKAGVREQKDTNVTVKYSLLRTYEPYIIKEKNDPLIQTKKYLLNSGNNYTVTEKIKFPCVLTSGRFHAAGLTLVNKVLGNSKGNGGIVTKLKKTTFEFDVDNFN